ncbi:unnamed protein product [Rhizophagus irregularis]|nr:unnamed protein product [Rhizophagus irregularis]
MEWNDCEITNSLKIDQENVSQIENPIIRHPKGKSPGTARFKGPLEASNEVNKSYHRLIEVRELMILSNLSSAPFSPENRTLLLIFRFINFISKSE